MLLCHTYIPITYFSHLSLCEPCIALINMSILIYTLKSLHRTYTILRANHNFLDKLIIGHVNCFYLFPIINSNMMLIFIYTFLSSCNYSPIIISWNKIFILFEIKILKYDYFKVFVILLKIPLGKSNQFTLPPAVCKCQFPYIFKHFLNVGIFIFKLTCVWYKLVFIIWFIYFPVPGTLLGLQERETKLGPWPYFWPHDSS